MLTNWSTISKSIKKLDHIEKVLEDEELIATYTKKEILDFSRKRGKLLKSLSGIRKIGGRPDLLVIIDTNREHLAISEAVKLGVPIVAVVDSNSDPDNINYPIPGNDDAIRSIRLYCTLFADAALAGIQDALADSGVDVGSANKVAKENKTLDVIVGDIADLIAKRADCGKNYGAILIPEGLIEFIPEVMILIQELNKYLVSNPDNFKDCISKESIKLLESLPQNIQKQLVKDRDPHGNVQVAHIETEKLLIEKVSQELKKRKKEGEERGKKLESRKKH